MIFPFNIIKRVTRSDISSFKTYETLHGSTTLKRASEELLHASARFHGASDMLPHTFHTRPKLSKCLLILLKLRIQTTCHKTKLLRLRTWLCLSPAPRVGSLKSRARFSANTIFHSNRALTQETLSLANTIALGVDQLLKPSRETSARPARGR